MSEVTGRVSSVVKIERKGTKYRYVCRQLGCERRGHWWELRAAAVEQGEMHVAAMHKEAGQ